MVAHSLVYKNRSQTLKYLGVQNEHNKVSQGSPNSDPCKWHTQILNTSIHPLETGY